ncbi:MAG: uroporphyrinogen-III C-methyltransferase [Mailhella sp.]|nr:uroporphyrinogen-III C-methyltransferase [Mailhella sp.]
MYVYLIGAGPGDPGLLTCKGRDILGKADVIVYDYLAADDLLVHARPDAERIYVGKIAGNHAMTQGDINRLLVRKAQEGKVVARLKGGDPYIFGRGGEEAMELYESGIPFEVVPGVTSAIAAPAYAGIPLTHRACSSSLTIITGHEDPSKADSAHDWNALARSGSTLVILMGMKNLPEITSRLLAAGMPKGTPAALVNWGTTLRQRSLTTTLEDLPSAAAREGYANPSIIVVGEVASMRDKLGWFEKKPLFGRTIVVTRAREQASSSAALFAERGAKVIQFPVIRIQPANEFSELDHAIAGLSEYQWIIFTSANGVRFFHERMEKLGLDARCLAGVQIAAIGPATAQAVRLMGILPDFVPESYVAESIAEGLCTLGMEGKRVLLPRASQARDVLPETLRKAGASVDIIAVYDTIPSAEGKEMILEELEHGGIDCVTFGSSSTVRNFFGAIGSEIMRKHPEVKLAAIGPVTAQTLRSMGFDPDILPEEFTIPALADAVCTAFSGSGAKE